MDCARIVVGNWKMNKLPKEGTVFISVNDNDKVKAIALARDMEELGFGIISTHGTSQLLNNNGITTKKVYKVGEGRPNIVDYIKLSRPDILMIQEIKTEIKNFPYEDFKKLGYESHVLGQKSYNGVAIISKIKMDNITTEFFKDKKKHSRIISANVKNKSYHFFL